MGKKIIEIEVKTPDWATPSVLRVMRAEGKSLREIAELIGVSREWVRKLLLKEK